MMYKEFYFSGNSMPAVVAIKIVELILLMIITWIPVHAVLCCVFFVVLQLILIEMDQIKNISYKSALSFLNLELE